MRSNFENCLAFVLKDEGGYAERNTEGGGAVNMGVTFTVYEAWRKSQGIMTTTFADLKAMPVAHAAEIYREQYADGIHFDEIPAGIDYAVLDASILGGVTGAIKVLQAALGLKVDGHYGLVTRWAVQHRDVPALIDKFCDLRQAKYESFKRFKEVAIEAKGDKPAKTWGEIWTARIKVVRKRAHSLVQTVSPAPVPATAAPKYAAPLPVKPAPKSKMPASTELSRGMLKIGILPADFRAYLAKEVEPKIAAWTGQGICYHNTGKMVWPGIVTRPDGSKFEISPEQRLDNMTVDWQKRGFKSSVSLVISPKTANSPALIWVCWPLHKPGTHSPSFNSSHWGIEVVGDFRTEKLQAEQREAAEIAGAGLLHMIGRQADASRLRFHKEDPRTSHGDCPGVNFGTKAAWILAVNEEIVRLNPGGL